MFVARIERLVAVLRVGLGVLVATLLFSASVSAGPPVKTDLFDVQELIASGFTNFVDVGDTMLVRTPNGVSVQIWTTGLEPSAVYTVWWAIDPGGPNACVMWATGHPIGPNGTGYFAAHLKEGEPWTEEEPSVENGGAGPCPGLLDAENQTIWVVTRSHGPLIPGLVYEQMGTYLGGCDTNTCTDDQIAFFFPVDP